MHLAQLWTGTDDVGRSVVLAKGVQAADVWLGLPFLPLYKSPSGEWRYWCQHLTREGRCGIYDQRPAVCRAYEPGSDRGLCGAMYSPEAGKRLMDKFLQGGKVDVHG